MANMRITSVVLIVVALITTIIALSVNHWSQQKITKSGEMVEESQHGIVKMCACVFGRCECSKFSDAPLDKDIAYIRACLAGVCLAFIGSLVALVAGIVWVLNVGSGEIQKLLKPAIIVALIFAVFWNFVAVVVFSAMDRPEAPESPEGLDFSYSLGYGWGMAILAMILQGIAIVTTIFTEKNM